MNPNMAYNTKTYKQNTRPVNQSWPARNAAVPFALAANTQPSPKGIYKDWKNMPHTGHR